MRVGSPRALRRFALFGGLVVAGLASGDSLSAQPSPEAPPDERRRVDGWRVEHGAEEDGGRIVRMERSRDGLVISYHVAFWRGNAGPLSSFSAELRGRSCASRSWRRDPNGDVWRAEADPVAAIAGVRARLTEALAECGRRGRKADAVLAGFERAALLASSWEESARLATLAEAAAIANEGRDAQAAPDAAPPPASGPD